MPLADRWYMHDKNCQCDKCITHKRGKARKVEPKRDTKKQWVVLTPQATKPLPQSKPVPKPNPYRIVVVLATLVITLIISLLIGIAKYYPIIIVATLLSLVIPLPKKK